jgi:hypothetical protein
MKSTFIRSLLIAFGLFGSGLIIGVLIGSRRAAPPPTYIWDVALPIPQDGIVWVHWFVWEREYPEARPHYWNLLRKIRVGYLQHAPAGGSISFFIRQIVDGTFSKPMRYLSEVLSTW